METQKSDEKKSAVKTPARKGIVSLVFGGLWRVIKPHSTTIGIVLIMLFLCFLMTMVAFGLILSKIQRTYAVLVMFITTFVLTIPSHFLLIRLIYRLTGNYFFEKQARDQELQLLRTKLSEREQEAETRRNNNFPQERGRKVNRITVWEQRIDQPIFDSIPYEPLRHLELDRDNLLVRGAKKVWHGLVPVRLNREREKPDKSERLYVAGHISGCRNFWFDATEILVDIDDPARFVVYGLDERAIHAGFLDSAETSSLRVEKYFSWAVSAVGAMTSPDSIKKFELVRDDEMTLRSSRIALHWDKLVDDIKNDVSKTLEDALTAAREHIAATLRTMDATKEISFVDARQVADGTKLLSYFALIDEKKA